MKKSIHDINSEKLRRLHKAFKKAFAKEKKDINKISYLGDIWSKLFVLSTQSWDSWAGNESYLFDSWYNKSH